MIQFIVARVQNDYEWHIVFIRIDLVSEVKVSSFEVAVTSFLPSLLMLGQREFIREGTQIVIDGIVQTIHLFNHTLFTERRMKLHTSQIEAFDDFIYPGVNENPHTICGSDRAPSPALCALSLPN